MDEGFNILEIKPSDKTTISYIKLATSVQTKDNITMIINIPLPTFLAKVINLTTKFVMPIRNIVKYNIIT